MEEIIVMVLKGIWGLIQAVYYLVRFIIQTIFFIRAKMPKVRRLTLFLNKHVWNTR